jgi:hypothetical protein
MTAMSAQSASAFDAANPFPDLNAHRVTLGKWTKF